jgi:hypothetical protein
MRIFSFLFDHPSSCRNQYICNTNDNSHYCRSQKHDESWRPAWYHGCHTSETQNQLIVTIRIQQLWLQRPLQPCNPISQIINICVTHAVKISIVLQQTYKVTCNHSFHPCCKHPPSSQTQIWLILNKMIKLKKWT